MEREFVTEWGEFGSGDGQFSFPTGIDVDGSGNVYVADLGGFVQKFGGNGAFITKWGSEGSSDGQFQDPRGIAAGSAGVYVADTFNHRGSISTSMEPSSTRGDRGGRAMVNWCRCRMLRWPAAATCTSST